MNRDELESQLSAMFDGELPAAECELLSRRIDREENLRACWARYALIGAAMRSEPVATARRGFAARVSAALAGRPYAAVSAGRRQSLMWSAALAAGLVAGVAGVSIMMLRDAALRQGGDAALRPLAAMNVAQVPSEAAQRMAPVPATDARARDVRALNGAPSYVTPAARVGANTFLRTQLADYIVAHSAFSTPLVRRNLLSELVTGEDGVGIAPGFAGAAVGADATTALPAPGR
ncbi:MAG: sigma-E factor negative regulatory protein [Steroidobacteraceae bacterium]